MVWEDAFTDLKASVRVTYTKAGMEHDVVLRSAPPPPSGYGLPESSLLEVWHELVDVPWQEAPLKSSATNGPTPNAKIVFAKDQSLALGSMIMGQGRAFSLGTDSPEVDLPAL